MFDDSQTPQYLAREFANSLYNCGLELVQVASTDRQPKNLYALHIKFGESCYQDCNIPDFLINEETLKDAVALFLFDNSSSGSEFEYAVTNDLIEATFAIVKAKIHYAIATGHIELLLDPHKHKDLVEGGEIGKHICYISTMDNKEASK